MVCSIHNELNIFSDGAKFPDNQFVANKREVVEHVFFKTLWTLWIIILTRHQYRYCSESQESFRSRHSSHDCMEAGGRAKQEARAEVMVIPLARAVRLPLLLTLLTYVRVGDVELEFS
jgi:hypothetical protein